MEETYYFTWPDYLVLSVMLAISAAIGFYYACSGDKQRTTREYLLADRNMHWFPVGCSLLASFISSQTLIGLPGEIYTFGTIIIYSYLFQCFAIIGATVFYLPVMKSMECISVFKYIELRFGKPLKYVLEISSVIATQLYATLVIYGPALSIAAVTGINLWSAVLAVALIAMLYTVLGGMKAVLWTDTMQLIIMLIGVILVLIMGSINEGGIREVWEVNRLSGRLDMLEPKKFLDIDPRTRHTVWVMFLNSIPMHCGVYGYGQSSLQRALTLRSSKDLNLAYGMTAIGTTIFGTICAMMGLVIFAHYKLCDPIKDGHIFTKDQLYPLYVMELLGHIPGLPGIIFASMLSASLSTISSVLSSNSALLLQDFIQPLTPNLQDKHAAIITRIVAFALGIVAIVLVLFTKYFGSGMLSMGMTLSGIFGGPAFAVFTLGIFFPTVNQRNAFVGFLCGIAMGAWIGFGGLTKRPYIYHYPIGTVGCNVTDVTELSSLASPVYDPSTWDPESHYRSGVDAIYDISYMWAGPGSAIISILVSWIVSLCPVWKDEKLVEKRLLSPFLFKSCCRMPKSWKMRIQVDDCDQKVCDEGLSVRETMLDNS